MKVFEGIGMKTIAILILLLMSNGFLTPVSADSGKRFKITEQMQESLRLYLTELMPK
jgi:hypothetical protein